MDYVIFVVWIVIFNFYKEIKKVFFVVVYDLYVWVNFKIGKYFFMIDDDVYKVVMDNKDIFDFVIIYDRDFVYNYFGFKIFERLYFFRINGKIVECF